MLWNPRRAVPHKRTARTDRYLACWTETEAKAGTGWQDRRYLFRGELVGDAPSQPAKSQTEAAQSKPAHPFWAPLPSLLESRWKHSCGRFVTDSILIKKDSCRTHRYSTIHRCRVGRLASKESPDSPASRYQCTKHRYQRLVAGRVCCASESLAHHG